MYQVQIFIIELIEMPLSNYLNKTLLYVLLMVIFFKKLRSVSHCPLRSQSVFKNGTNNAAFLAAHRAAVY